MDLLTFLMVAYAVIIAILFAVAFILQRRGRGGKLSRAFFITAATGVVVILLVYPLYPSLVRPPVDPPPRPIDPNALLLPQFLASLKNDLLPAIGQAIGYAINRMLDPFIYGVLAMVIAFPFSFLIPHSGRSKTAKPTFQPAN
jgi:hypothetical protein